MTASSGFTAYFRLWHNSDVKGGQSTSALPPSSDINLLSDGKCIINFNAEVTNRTFDFRVTQEQLDGPEITRSAINEGRFSSAQRMGAKKARIQSDAFDPPGY
jgi:hypothetical protein